MEQLLAITCESAGAIGHHAGSLGGSGGEEKHMFIVFVMFVNFLVLSFMHHKNNICDNFNISLSKSNLNTELGKK